MPVQGQGSEWEAIRQEIRKAHPTTPVLIFGGMDDGWFLVAYVYLTSHQDTHISVIVVSSYRCSLQMLS